MPIFGLLTPLPATPLYKRLEAAGRLTRRKHWQEFIPFAMAHTPLKMTIDEAHAEVNYGWAQAYSPEALANAVEALDNQSLGYRINIFLARPCFRGIYFPMLGHMAWVKVIVQNRQTISKLLKEAVFGRKARRPPSPDREIPYQDAVTPESRARSATSCVATDEVPAGGVFFCARESSRFLCGFQLRVSAWACFSTEVSQHYVSTAHQGERSFTISSFGISV